MKRLAALALVLAAPAFPQKESPPFPPEIAPPDFTHRDVLRVDPNHYRKDLENDHTRVLRLNLKADESVPLHDANDGLFVCLRECHLRLTDPGGRIQDVHLEAGQTRWIGAGARSEKNLSTKPVEMPFIEWKPRSSA